jgi:hypothetical protein
MDTRTTDLLTDAHLDVVFVGNFAIVHYEAAHATITLHFAVLVLKMHVHFLLFHFYFFIFGS